VRCSLDVTGYNAPIFGLFFVLLGGKGDQQYLQPLGLNFGALRRLVLVEKALKPSARILWGWKIATFPILKAAI